MRHWIMMFRPETYELVKRHETIAVNPQHGPRFFREIADGDRFVIYVSHRRVIDGHGEIIGEPFVDTAPIFGEERDYPHRCKVRFQQTGAAVDASGDVLWGLAPFEGMEMKTTPTNYIFLKGGFLEISERDYQELVGLASRKRS